MEKDEPCRSGDTGDGTAPASATAVTTRKAVTRRSGTGDGDSPLSRHTPLSCPGEATAAPDPRRLPPAAADLQDPTGPRPPHSPQLHNRRRRPEQRPISACTNSTQNVLMSPLFSATRAARCCRRHAGLSGKSSAAAFQVFLSDGFAEKLLFIQKTPEFR